MALDKKKVFISVLAALLGGFFIFSAITKTIPIEYFEYTLRSQLNFSEKMAPLGARFFIGLEFGLGLLLLLQLFGKRKWVISASIALMIAFTIHLAILYFQLGNEVNCGCMGEQFYMPPLPSILKNILILILLGILYTQARKNNRSERNLLSFLFLALSIALPYLIFAQRFLPIDKIYNGCTTPIESLQLEKDKKFIGFLSLTCPHCKDAAEVMRELKMADSSLPIYVFFGNIDNDSLRADLLQQFIQETKFDNVPYYFLDKEPFVELSGGAVPSLYWTEYGKIVRKPSMSDISLKELKLWLSK